MNEITALDLTQVTEEVQRKTEEIMDQTVIYFPMRHHSLACSFYLEKVIDQYQPEKILIELPTGAEECIPIVVSDKTHPPIAFHSFFVDKKNEFQQNGILSPAINIPVRFEGYVPLTVYSPEYVALQKAKEKDIPVEFIDLPLKNMIPYIFNRSAQSLLYPDETFFELNIYGSLLAKKLRCRSFHEVWETLFEANLSLDPEEFMRRVLTFSVIAKNTFPQEMLEQNGVLQREEYMRFRIKKAFKQLSDKTRKGALLVVTGTFHSVVLPFLKGKSQSISKKANLVLIVPYSFDQLSFSRGYSSGNPAPRYYDRVWSKMVKNADSVYDSGSLNLILEIKGRAREFGSVVSVADSIHAFRLAKNLSRFRGKNEIGLFDLTDAIETVFIKGEKQTYGPPVHKAVEQILIGDEIGNIDPELSQLPLLADFQYQAKQLRIKLLSTSKLLRVNLYQTDLAQRKSQFLHQTVFLELGFAQMIKGPNLLKKENLHLLAEQWEVVYTKTVENKLSQLSSLGNTIRNACLTSLNEKFAAISESGVASKLLLLAAQMGLVEILPQLGLQLIDIIDKDRDFKSLVQSLLQLVSLYNYQESLLTEGFQPLLSLINQAYVRAVLLIPSVVTVSEDDEETIIENLKALTNFILTFTDIEIDKDLFVSQIQQALSFHEGNRTICGALVGTLYSLHQYNIDDISREINGYFAGGALLEGGNFLYGLFTICREILILKESFFDCIDTIVGSISNEAFLGILPLLRRSFSLFTPREIDIIASKIAKKRKLEKFEIKLDEDLVIVLQAVDQIAAEKFGAWGL